MAATMKVKKGDLVQILSGKDRGKQGKVLEARPAEGRVIVENLNVAKRHTKPRPMRDANRMGGTTMMPGGLASTVVAMQFHCSSVEYPWMKTMVVSIVVGSSSSSTTVGLLTSIVNQITLSDDDCWTLSLSEVASC